MALSIIIVLSVKSAFCGVQCNSDLPQRGKGGVHSMGKGRDREIQQRRQRRRWRINQRSQMQVQFDCPGNQVMIYDYLHEKFNYKSIMNFGLLVPSLRRYLLITNY